jgi:glycosyltransferase involved in cell wall biosynthesis
VNILFIADNFPPETNAAASRVFERARLWSDWGHRVTVVTSAPNFPQGKVYAGYKNKWYAVERMAGVRVVRVKTLISPNRGTVSRILDFWSFMVMAIAGGLWQRRPEVVVATSPQFFAAVGGWMLARLRRVPFVFELGDLWPASIVALGAMRPGVLLGMTERLELFLYRRAAAIVALTPAFKHDLIERGIRPDKIHVVLNGVDCNLFSPRRKDETLAARLGLADKFVVGYIGTHGLAHDLNNVLVAAKELLKFTDIRFLFIGEGAERGQLVATAGAWRLHNVVFVPGQAKAAIADYWSLCDAALIHLKQANVLKTVIPSKTFEAMAMGLPIIYRGPEGETSRLLQRRGNGLCALSGDPAELADAVLNLRRDDKLRARLSQNSLAAAEDYSRARQAATFISVLERVLCKDEPAKVATRDG